MITALRMDISPRVFKVFRRHLTVYRRNWKVSLSFNYPEIGRAHV